MWNLIVMIVVGFIIGLIARAIKPGDDSMNFIWTTVLGILGSILATYVGSFLNLYSNGQAAGYIASVIGAIILIYLVGFIKKKIS